MLHQDEPLGQTSLEQSVVVEHNLLLEFFILIHATLHELIHLLCLLVTVVLYGLLSIDIVNMLTVHLLELLLVSLAWLWQSLR